MAGHARAEDAGLDSFLHFRRLVRLVLRTVPYMLSQTRELDFVYHGSHYFKDWQWIHKERTSSIQFAKCCEPMQESHETDGQDSSDEQYLQAHF